MQSACVLIFEPLCNLLVCLCTWTKTACVQYCLCSKSAMMIVNLSLCAICLCAKCKCSICLCAYALGQKLLVCNTASVLMHLDKNWLCAYALGPKLLVWNTACVLISAMMIVNLSLCAICLCAKCKCAICLCAKCKCAICLCAWTKTACVQYCLCAYALGQKTTLDFTQKNTWTLHKKIPHKKVNVGQKKKQTDKKKIKKICKSTAKSTPSG